MALLILTGIGIKAQSFEFQYKGEGLADDATITIAAEDDAFGQLSCETNHIDNPSDGLVLKLLLFPTANMYAELQITHNTLDAETLQWCMGGTCMLFDGNSLLTKQFDVDGSVQVQFDASNIHSSGYLSAVLTARVGLESHKVNIEFTNGEQSGVCSVVNHKYVERVYDLNGRRVKGRIANGIYLISNGKGIRKTIIK